MADTQRSVSDVLALLADNQARAISPQDLRDALVSWRPAHGQIYVAAAAAAAVSFSDSTNYFEATNPAWTINNDDCYLFDESAGNGRLTYTGAIPVMAHIACTVSMTSGSNNQVIHARLGITGTPNAAAEIQQKITTGSDVRSTAIHLVTMFDPGDYVSLWLRNATSTANVTLEVANMQLMTMPM